VLILLGLGIPIYLVLMGVASFLLLMDGRTLAGLGQHVLDHLNSPILIAVPFFILAAVLMRGGGLANVLFSAALSWIGWMPGGLAIAGIAATAVFAAITGSSAATAMAMGTLLVPILVERGYDRSLMQAGMFALYIFFVAGRVGGSPEPMVSRAEFVRTNIHAFPAMLIPVVVLGGIYGGFVTLTEAAVLGAGIALVAVLFIYRSAPLKAIPGMLTEAVDRTSVIVLIIMGATLVSAPRIRPNHHRE